MEKGEIKIEILGLLNAVKREGMPELIKFLDESDFFKAPCSMVFHLCREGGLAEHSLNVYNLLKEKIERYKVDVPPESVIICGILHDLCKVNFYKIGGEDATDAQMKYLRTFHNPVGKVSKKYASKLIEFFKSGGNAKTMPQPEPEWTIEDKFPFGHGEKSVSVAQDFIKLTVEEKLAIRWHLLAFDAGIHFNFPSGYPFRTASESPLVVLTFTADYEASQILEMGK
jgi:hypothetical protein